MTGRARRIVACCASASVVLGLLVACGTSAATTGEPVTDTDHLADAATDDDVAPGVIGTTVTAPEGWDDTMLTVPTWPATEGRDEGELIPYVLYEGQSALAPEELVETTSTIDVDDRPHTLQCAHPVAIGKHEVRCPLLDEDEQGPDAQVRLAPSPYAHSHLMVRVPGEQPAALNLPGGVPVIAAPLEVGAAEELSATAVQDAAVEALTSAYREDGDAGTRLQAQCTLADDLAVAACSLTGTPDGAADGVWYGAAHSGPDGSALMVLGKRPR